MTDTLTRAGLAFEAPAKPFAEAIDWVAQHLARPSLPILGGVLLEVDNRGLVVSGYDGETIATHARLDVEAAVTGRVLVSGRLLAAIAKTFSAKPVDAAVRDRELVVRCGTATLTLPLMIDGDYPTLPTRPPAIGTMAAVEFAALVDRVAIAADRAGAYAPALIGVHLRFEQGTVRALAADGYRMATGTSTWTGRTTDTVEALAPSPALIEAAKLADGDVEICFDSGMIAFVSATRSIAMRQVAEKYPLQIEGLIPQRVETPAAVRVADLRAALRRAALVRAEKTPVRLTFGHNSISVAAADAAGAIKTGEEIDCDYAGPAIEIGINPGYLVDALNGLRSDIAEISMTEPNRAVLLTAPDGAASYRHVVQPISLKS